MPAARISKRTVDGLRVDPARDVYLWDTDVKGFAVKLTPAGSRTYLVQYDIPGGRTRRYTIGRHGDLTPEQARAEAVRVRAEVALGRDPADEKASTRAAGMTVAELCELYLAEGCATKKASTIAMDRSRITCHVLPLLGRVEVKALTRADVERCMQKIAAGETAKPRVKGEVLRATHRVLGGKGAATRTMGMLSGILTFAVNRGLRADNPCSSVKRYADRKVERRLSLSELGRLGEALTTLETAGYYAAAALAGIRLLALTGCRRNEVMTLEWSWVDLEHNVLWLPDSKQGKKEVPLPPPAVAVLASLPRSGRYVLPGDTGEPYTGIQRVWEAVRKLAKLPDLRLHDLRHAYASLGAATGESAVILGKVLGHKHPSTTARYMHLGDDPLRAAAGRISGAIAAAMAPKPAPVPPPPHARAQAAPQASASRPPPARPERAVRPSSATRARRPGA